MGCMMDGYVSAKDAADDYVSMSLAREDVKAFDPGKVTVQTSARPSAPGFHHIEDLQELNEVFLAARDRLYPTRLQWRRSGFSAICAAVVLTSQHARWQAWCYVRIGDRLTRETMSHAEAASALCVPKTTMQRWLAHVDTLIEQELGDRGHMRADRTEAGSAQGQYSGDVSVRGPKQKARSVYVGMGDDV